MTSILTNNGAMVALQTLKSINSNLESTQNEISTGKKIANAKDNSAIWAISKTMESDVQGFEAISQSLSLGESTVAVARTAAETVTDTLKLMKEEIVAAQDGTVDRAKLQERVSALRDQISATVGAAQFNGVNLVSGNISTTTVTDFGADGAYGGGDDTTAAGIDVLASLDRAGTGVGKSMISVQALDLSADALAGLDTDGTTAVTLDAIDVSTEGGAQTALSAIEGMIAGATAAGASFGSVQDRIETQSKFVSNLTDTMKSGIGSLVDADMEEASAKLKALQTQQQLGVQSLSIANQAPGAIMSLFR